HHDIGTARPRLEDVRDLEPVIRAQLLFEVGGDRRAHVEAEAAADLRPPEAALPQQVAGADRARGEHEPLRADADATPVGTTLDRLDAPVGGPDSLRLALRDHAQ